MSHTVIVDRLPDLASWFDRITNGIIIQNSLGRVVRYNVAALELLRLSADQMLGLTEYDPRWHLINEDLSSSKAEDFPAIQALRTGQPIVDVLLGVIHLEKNRYNWLRVSSHPYCDTGESTPSWVLTTLADMTSWKESRDALLQEQQLFRKGPVVAVQTKGEAGRLIFLSENFQALFGLDPGPFLEGRANLWDRISPDDRQILSQAWQTAKNDSVATSFGGRFRFKDGRGDWREITHQTIFARSSSGREPETLAYWLDRTDEAHLLRRLTLTLEAARVGTWDWSNLTGGVAFDAAWSRLTGYSSEDLADMNIEKWYQLIHPSDQGLWRYATQKVTVGEALAIDIEVRQRQPSGAWSWYQIRGKAFERDSDGRPIRVLGIQEDVSHKVLAEQERSALSQVVEQGPSAVILTDVNGAIEYVNRQFTLQTGYDLRDVQGQNPRIWKSPEADPVTYREMWTTLTAGQTWHGEFKNRKKDGSPYWVQSSISPLTDASGQIYRYAGQQIDITARKAVDESLKKAREDADAANQAKSDFLAHMSHEIRTPMNGILGMADLALGRPMDTQSKTQIENIKVSAESLLSLVNDILDVSKIEAGMMELESISFSMNEMIQNVLTPLQILASKKGLLLEIHRDEALVDRRIGDPTRLGQILTNLVGNALKFTQDGSVTVTVSDDKKSVSFAVRDTGPGVPAEHRHRLFQRFSQTEASTARNFGGSGLGLSICREFVERMGGEIGYKEAQSPSGGIFWFSVPLEADPRPVASGSSVRLGEEPPSWKGARILVVEDNVVNQQVAIGLLGRHGIVPQVASNGEEALRVLKSGTFDLVLMDVQMPVMDGVTSTRAIRRGEGGEAHRRVPIVAMTANATGGDREICFDAGMDDYLTKPISAVKFAGLLKKWEENFQRTSRELWSIDTFDLDEMRERLQLEDEMVLQIVRLFLGGLPGRRQAVVQAAQSKQTDELLRLAHAIKGTAANLVAKGVVDAAIALELVVPMGNDEQTGRCLESLLTELDLLQAALRHFSQSWESSFPAH